MYLLSNAFSHFQSQKILLAHSQRIFHPRKYPSSMVSLNHLRSDRYTSPLPDSPEFSAACLSLVIHPQNPHALTVHANHRHSRQQNKKKTPNRPKRQCFGLEVRLCQWDLTPSYLYEEDAVHFHSTLQSLHAINVDPNSTPRLRNGLVNTLFLVRESQEEKEEYFSTMIEDQVWVDTWREDWEYSDEIIRDCRRV